MRFNLWTITLASILSGVVAPPASAKDLAPTSVWALDYADDSCALRRSFGEGRDHTYLEFRRFSPGTLLQTTVASGRMRARNPADISFRFGDGEWSEQRAFSLVMEAPLKGGVLFTSTIVDPSDQAIDGDMPDANIDWRSIEQAATDGKRTLRLRGAFASELNMQLGSLRAPINALNDCIDELMTHWGIDVEAHKTLTRRPTPIDMAAASRMVGYPPKMAAKGMPGMVNVRLAIDERGMITGCRIQMPLSDPEFEASSCADIQHAFEFEPALDKDGDPIASYWITRVVFQIAG